MIELSVTGGILDKTDGDTVRELSINIIILRGQPNAELYRISQQN